MVTSKPIASGAWKYDRPTGAPYYDEVTFGEAPAGAADGTTYTALIGLVSEFVADERCEVVVVENEFKRHLIDSTGNKVPEYGMSDRMAFGVAELRTRIDDIDALAKAHGEADSVLTAAGWTRVDAWRSTGGAMYATVERSAYTAEINVVTGELEVAEPQPVVDGMRVNDMTVEPWGEDEFGYERADEALSDLGLERVGDWHPDGERATCTVQVRSQMTSYGHLYDMHTGDPIGPATEEQYEASMAAGDTGAIIIDDESGEVLDESADPAVYDKRTVYVQP